MTMLSHAYAHQFSLHLNRGNEITFKFNKNKNKNVEEKNRYFIVWITLKLVKIIEEK